MPEYPIDQSLWGRGWLDTKRVWTSWQFVLLDAVVCVVIGGLFEWYWGLALFVFALFCVWLGATVSAPIKQRNEARYLLQQKKTINIPNKDDLVRAIGNLGQKALFFFEAQESLESMNKNAPGWVHTDHITARDNARKEYEQARSELENERLVAGESVSTIVNLFIIRTTLDIMSKAIGESPTGLEDRALNRSEFEEQLGIRIADVVGEIRQISQ